VRPNTRSIPRSRDAQESWSCFVAPVLGYSLLRCVTRRAEVDLKSSHPGSFKLFDNAAIGCLGLRRRAGTSCNQFRDELSHRRLFEGIIDTCQRSDPILETALSNFAIARRSEHSRRLPFTFFTP